MRQFPAVNTPAKPCRFSSGGLRGNQREAETKGDEKGGTDMQSSNKSPRHGRLPCIERHLMLAQALLKDRRQVDTQTGASFAPVTEKNVPGVFKAKAKLNRRCFVAIAILSCRRHHGTSINVIGTSPRIMFFFFFCKEATNVLASFAALWFFRALSWRSVSEVN